MPFPNTDTQFKPGESGNPAGKPKGAIHLSTMIQDYLNEELDPDTVNPKEVGKTRMKALVATAFIKADAGDNKWAEWLAKYGYGQKLQLEHSGEVNTGTNDPTLAAQFADYIKEKSRD